MSGPYLGSTAARFAVDADGGASYTVPIQVPPATDAEARNPR